MALTHAEMNAVIQEEIAVFNAKTETDRFREAVKEALEQVTKHNISRADPRVVDMLQSVKKQFL